MITLPHTRLAVLATAAAMGIGTAAVPSAVLASTHTVKHSSSATDRSGHDSSSPRQDKQSPDTNGSSDDSRDR
jgi:hypothetical protein